MSAKSKPTPDESMAAPNDAPTPKQNPPAPSKVEGSVGTTGKSKRILIVEDEHPLSHALEMKLKGQQYETRVVMNGIDALEAMKNEKYDLILLDLIMPMMDGFAVLEELKTLKSKIPVIVLSNLGQDEDRAKTKELGAIDYFVKSNTPIADIIARVKTAL